MPKCDLYIVGGLALMMEPGAEAVWAGQTVQQFLDGIGAWAILAALVGFLLVWRGVTLSGALNPESKNDA